MYGVRIAVHREPHTAPKCKGRVGPVLVICMQYIAAELCVYALVFVEVNYREVLTLTNNGSLLQNRAFYL